jgi:hypothetical protein
VPTPNPGRSPGSVPGTSPPPTCACSGCCSRPARGRWSPAAGSSPGYEHQFLYGIRTDEQRRLAAAGRAVRVYVPCGTDWWAYFIRRLAERPANLVFFLRALVGR